MIRLDEIEILCPFNPQTMYIKDFGTTSVRNGEVFKSVFPMEAEHKDNIKISYSKYCSGPFSREKTEYDKGELRVYVNSKVLGKDYFEKINTKNIEQCLQTALERAGKKIFDPEELIENGRTKGIHVTTDIPMTISKQDGVLINSFLLKPTKWTYDDSHKNDHRWTSKYYGESGRRSLKMYNKESQMGGSARRRRFVEKNEIAANTFDNSLRLELKLMSPSIIRKGLDIQDTRIENILSVSESPITRFINNVFDLSDYQSMTGSSVDSLEELEMLSVIEKHDNDWLRVEREIRRFKKSNAGRFIGVYKAFFHRMMEKKSRGTNGVEILHDIVNLVNDDFAQN